MSNFKVAVEEVLKREGGFVNHPNDKGGATNMGITIGTLSKWLGRPATIDDVRNMTRDTAIAIYKKNYWDVVWGDKIKYYSVASAIFDQAVNRGPASALKQAQKIIGTTQDGIMGPKTLEALNKMPDSQFLPLYFSESASFYNRLVQNDPSQGVFLVGWLKRIQHLQDHVYGYLGTVQGQVVSVAVIASLAIGGYFIYKMMNQPTTVQRIA